MLALRSKATLLPTVVSLTAPGVRLVKMAPVLTMLDSEPDLSTTA